MLCFKTTAPAFCPYVNTQASSVFAPSAMHHAYWWNLMKRERTRFS